MEGVKVRANIWQGLKGQIYLGDDDFVDAMQNKIGKEKDDFNIPHKQTRRLAPSLAKIDQRSNSRDTAIITAYSTGAYSQREIGEFYGLHPSTVGVIVRNEKKTDS